MKCQSCQSEQGAVQFVTYKAANGLDVHICQRCLSKGLDIKQLVEHQQQNSETTIRRIVREELAKIRAEEGKP